MLKLGIVRRDALGRPTPFLGKRRHASFLLLLELAQHPEVDPADYDSLVEQVCMPNGVWKQTARGRLAVLDAAVCDILRGRLATRAPIAVLDLAASTGVTSVDLYQRLTREFTVEFIASDLYRDVIAVRSRVWPWTGIFDTSTNEIQQIFGHFVLPGQIEESLVYPVNRLLKRLGRSVFLPQSRRLLETLNLSALPSFETVSVDGFQVIRMPLLCKDCLHTIATQPQFRFEVWDILQPLPRRAHVVRAMNILTQDHFPDTDRAQAVRHCVEATLPGGLVIFGWSPYPDPKTVEATVYEAVAGGLRRLTRLNGGSEIDRVVEQTVPVFG